jgi:hypothetical protein
MKLICLTEIGLFELEEFEPEGAIAFFLRLSTDTSLSSSSKFRTYTITPKGVILRHCKQNITAQY